jgi:hypothetical protein
MNPGIRRGQTPPFYEMDEFSFQDMCRDLFEKEPDIETCEVYGTRGQSQYGIDLKAYRENDDGIEVGQCKCYKSFSATDIQNASDKFFEYWDTLWSKKDVKRFVLFLACLINDVKCQNAVEKERKRFQKYGIKYEAWSAAKLQNKLRPNRSIVFTYLDPPEYWAKVICGETQTHLPFSNLEKDQNSILVSAAVTNQLNSLANVLSNETEQNLQMMRKAWREGRKSEAINWIRELKLKEKWGVISSEVKSKIIRFEASLELDLSEDINIAKKLADEAKGIFPMANDTRLRALIAFKEEGPESAIKILNGQEDIDSLNLNAAFLLELGRIDECRELFKCNIIKTKPDAETYRIQALLGLITNNLQEALLNISKALELEPLWESILFTAGIIYFSDALSPIVLNSIQENGLPSPHPIEWIMIKRDEESLKQIRKAHDIFNNLISIPLLNKNERITLEGWKLACLANDPEKQSEAIRYCQEILGNNPTHYYAIEWSIARNYNIDLSSSIKKLEKIMDNELIACSYVISLVQCYFQSKSIPHAIKLLNDKRIIFNEHQLGKLWTFWYVQILVLNDDLETAIQIVNDSNLKNDPDFQTILLQNSPDFKALFEHLERCYYNTNDPNYLLECCLLMNKQKKWSYIAEHAEELTQRIGTGDVLHFVVVGSYNAKCYDLCLNLLEKYCHLFFQQKLPGSLRKVRILCQAELGILSNAIIEAEKLVRDEPIKDNIMTLLTIYSSKGDFKNFAIISRKLLDCSDLNINQLLYLAWGTRWEDKSLSKEFWKKAVNQKIPDLLIASIITLGYQLGFEDELASLFNKMIELGKQGKGGIQSKKINELAQFIAEMNKQNQELWEIYRQGKVPIHHICEQLNIPLIYLYHRILIDNQQNNDILNESPLLIRYGGRTLVSGFPKEEIRWRINMDVTAILLANHLNILDILTKTFKPVRLPSDIVFSLVDMQEKLIPLQPSHLEIKKNIIRLVEQGDLEVVDAKLLSLHNNQELVDNLGEDWVALLEIARSQKGYLIDFLPLRKRDLSDLPVCLPEDTSRFVTNCRSVIDALRQHGPLSESEYENAIRGLGSEGMILNGVIPQDGSVLVCHGNIPEVLAGTGQIQTLCRRYKVIIEKNEFDRIKAELLQQEQCQKEINWLTGLINKISSGIDEGLFELIPFLPKKDKSNKKLFERPIVRCLLTLLKFDTGENDVIWVDDRFVSSYFYRDSVPIIGINEVLKSLVCIGSINESVYYNKIYQLWAANIRFIPVQKEEIIFYLQQANIQDGKLIETQELIILRRYIAACLYQNQIFQKPPMPENSHNMYGESAFVLTLKHELTNTLLEIWNVETDEKNCYAKIEWLLDNLFFDNLILPNFTNIKHTSENIKYFAGCSVAGMIFLAFELRKENLRKQYFTWFQERFLSDLFYANPSFVTVVVDILKKIIHDEFIKDESPGVRKYLQRFYDDLPDSIKNEFQNDVEFMRTIGFTLRKEISYNGLIFRSNEFWDSIHNVVNGIRMDITPLNIEKEITFELEGETQNKTIYFVNPMSNIKIIMDPIFNLLIDSPTEREYFIRKNSEWFDCDEKVFNQAIIDIVLTENYESRIEKAIKWRQSSYRLFLTELHEKLLREHRFLLSDLIPSSGQGMLQHFRFDSKLDREETIIYRIHQGISELSGGHLFLAIERLIGLPIPLPHEIIKEILNLSDTNKHELIKKLIKRCISPVSNFHFLYILNQLSDTNPAYLRLARRIVKYFFSSEGQLFIDAFISILRWTNSEFGNWVETKDWDIKIKLALVWAHSHHLYNCFLSSGLPVKWLQEIFDGKLKWVPQEIFERNPEYWFNVINPMRIKSEELLFFGLSYVFGEKNDLVDSGLRKLIESKIFMKTETEMVLPIFPLMRDFSRANNSLGSFIYGDQEKLKLLVSENSEVFSSDYLKSIVLEVIDKIEEQEELAYWFYLEMILGDLPCYDDLFDRLYNLLRNTAYDNYFNNDGQQTWRTILFASQQAINFKDEELCRHLKEQLIKIAKIYSKKLRIGEGENIDTICFCLFEAALNISIASEEGENVITKFVDIFIELINSWNLLAIKCKTVIQRLYSELPILQGQCFWKLLLRIRME